MVAAPPHQRATPATARRRPLAQRIPVGTPYRGDPGMWAWVAQRITGVLVYVFLVVHVLDTALVRVSPEAYNAIIATYKNPVVGVAEVGLVGAVLHHALNGLRITAVDLWARALRHQRRLLGGVLLTWVVLMVPFTIRHLSNVFGG